MGINECAFGRTADEVYCDIYQKLEKFGQVAFGRNGQTKELTHVCMSIADPTQRWVERRKPAVSPAFAIAELVMIMNGSDEAILLNAWNPALPKYQGKYDRYPGAYGKRLRYSFGFDQINRAYDALKNNPESRQVVMEIWKPDIDLPQSKGRPNNDDIPCNICSLLKIRDGKLLWTQIMRSNDIVFGLPYNFFQFTFLQEIIAGWLNVGVGEYMHISDSLHMYVNNKCCIDLGKNVHLNTEHLKLEKKESENIFGELLIRMKELSQNECTSGYIKSIVRSKYLPEAYQNMLILLCEYIAYRHNMDDEVIHCCEQNISNTLYRDLMKEWMNKEERNRQ